MSTVTPEMTAWVEQQEQAMIRAGLSPYAGGDGTFRWGVSALEPRPVSLRHLQRDHVQTYRRIFEQMRSGS